MSSNERLIDTSTPAVWRVLSVGQHYADWVVGAAKIRGADTQWPAVQSNLHHSVGVWPLRFRDRTTVLECIPERRLSLRARVRPIGHAHITFTLTPVGDRTQVVMTEVVDRGFASLFYGVFMRSAIRARNTETLRRLEQQAQRYAKS